MVAWTIATVHPSSLLRIGDEALRKRSYVEFVSDLKQAATRAATHAE